MELSREMLDEMAGGADEITDIIKRVASRRLIQVMVYIHDTEIAPLRAALQAILDEPHGCVFCDSGKLRNPAKGHDPECGFAQAEALLK